MYDFQQRIMFAMMNALGEGDLPEAENFIIGQTNLDAAETAQRIVTASTPLRAGVFLRKAIENVSSDYFYIGTDNTVSATTGFLVANNQPAWIEISDLRDIWFDGTTTDRDISYMAI